MSLSKLNRDTYLHSMGIQPWSVRSPIQKRQKTEPMIDQKTNISAPKESFLPKRVSPLIAKASEQNLSKISTALIADTVQFNLLFFVFADLLIISELPLHERKGLSPEQSRLLKSMRTSLGYANAEPLQSVVMIWPLIENSKIDQGEAAAFQAVKAQLKKQIDKYQSKYVVLMGVAACRYVLGAQTVFDEVRGQLIANEELCAAVTYGVNELLKVPTLKSSAWQDLQVVRQLLSK